MELITSIIQKLKIKELFSMLFIASIIITFMPENFADKISILEFREKYQVWISLIMIGIGCYYIFNIIVFIKNYIYCKIYNSEKSALSYMKNSMSYDEMLLLIQTFFDVENEEFKSSGYINISDGRKTPLVQKNIIYMASNIGKGFTFAYNLQPYALKFLNKNLKEENIRVENNKLIYNLK